MEHVCVECGPGSTCLLHATRHLQLCILCCSLLLSCFFWFPYHIFADCCHPTKCAGISLKTQELYAIVFATRYLDIFTDYISLYNTIMKLIFLGSSFSIVWYMRHHKVVRRSYDRDQDTFRHLFLVLPCLLLALVIHEKFTFKEVLVLPFCH